MSLGLHDSVNLFPAPSSRKRTPWKFLLTFLNVILTFPLTSWIGSQFPSMDWDCLGIQFYTFENRWKSFKCFGYVFSLSSSITAPSTHSHAPARPLVDSLFPRSAATPSPWSMHSSYPTGQCGEHIFTLSAQSSRKIFTCHTKRKKPCFPEFYFYLSSYLLIYFEPACCPNCFVSSIFINSPHITPDRVTVVCWQDPLASKHQMHDVPIKLDTCFSFPGIDFFHPLASIFHGKNC